MPVLTGETKFAFVAPMYNASQYVGRMMHSIVGQSYDNWRLILIDDVSSPEEQEKSRKLVDGFKELLKIGGEDPEKIKVVWNSENGRGKQWEVSNVLHGISMCDDEDVICRIDADDWLIDLDALTILNEAYTKIDCEALWSTHRWGHCDLNISGQLEPGCDPYKHPWVTSHLKTFRKRLLNGVPHENFINMNGDLIKRTGDQGLYLPALHNTQKRFFLNRCLYHYTIELKKETFQTDDAKFQRSEAEFIRKRGYVSSGPTWESVLGYT